MDDLISRTYMLGALGIFSDRENGDEHFLNGIETAREIAENAPVVDAVPVVRCKDCKYAHMTYDGEVKYCDIISMPADEDDYGYALYLPGDWFCADGERRDEDG